MEQFQYQTLRDILNVEGDRLKEFAEKYRKVKVQTSRKKIVNTKYATSQEPGVMNTMFMGIESPSRRRSQEAREARRLSNIRRYDSQGRGFVKTYDRSLSQNHDRRSQLRDLGRFQREHSRSRQSRLGKHERDQSWCRENRSSQSSKDRKG